MNRANLPSKSGTRYRTMARRLRAHQHISKCLSGAPMRIAAPLSSFVDDRGGARGYGLHLLSPPLRTSPRAAGDGTYSPHGHGLVLVSRARVIWRQSPMPRLAAADSKGQSPPGERNTAPLAVSRATRTLGRISSTAWLA